MPAQGYDQFASDEDRNAAKANAYADNNGGLPPVNSGYKDFLICQAMGPHSPTAKRRAIQLIHLVEYHLEPRTSSISAQTCKQG